MILLRASALLVIFSVSLFILVSKNPILVCTVSLSIRRVSPWLTGELVSAEAMVRAICRFTRHGPQLVTPSPRSCYRTRPWWNRTRSLAHDHQHRRFPHRPGVRVRVTLGVPWYDSSKPFTKQVSSAHSNRSPCGNSSAST